MPSIEKYLARTVRVNSTSDGDNVVVAAPGDNKQIIVLGYSLNVNAAGVVTVQDTTASPVIQASFEFVDGGGAVFAGSYQCPAFVLPVNAGIEVSNAAGVDTLGHMTYIVVSTR